MLFVTRDPQTDWDSTQRGEQAGGGPAILQPPCFDECDLHQHFQNFTQPEGCESPSCLQASKPSDQLEQFPSQTVLYLLLAFRSMCVPGTLFLLHLARIMMHHCDGAWCWELRNRPGPSNTDLMHFSAMLAPMFDVTHIQRCMAGCVWRRAWEPALLSLYGQLHIPPGITLVRRLYYLFACLTAKLGTSTAELCHVHVGSHPSPSLHDAGRQP